jgi:long-chain acyl-CoA synthetase
MNVATDLQRAAQADGDRTLIISAEGREYTYTDVWEASCSVASLIRQSGMPAGARVLIVLPNSMEFLAAYYGVLSVGCVAVPLTAATTAEYIRRVAAICAPALAIAGDTNSEAAAAEVGLQTIVLSDAASLGGESASPSPALLAADVPAHVLFTSGTTGEPKGATISHGALAANTTGIVEYLGLTAGDRAGVVLDFMYSYGNSLLHTHVRVGGSLALLGPVSFTKRVVALIGQHDCTGFAGVPSTFALLLRSGALETLNGSALRYITCAGGALPVEHIRRLRVRLPQVQLFLMYGQTEASARLSYLPPSEVDRRPGSIGRGMRGVRLEVLRSDGTPVEVGEEGEIVASGTSLMTGYWNDPEATNAVLRDGRLWTGDLAVLDDEGYISITGRRSELIKTGGFRVHPREIEECITRMPGVGECAVVGVTDELLGERLVACFTGAAAPTLTALRMHLRDSLPPFKWPTEVLHVADIPRTASGKVQRRQLAMLVDRLSGETRGGEGHDASAAARSARE